MRLLKPEKLSVNEIKKLPGAQEMTIIPEEHLINFGYLELSKKLIIDQFKQKSQNERQIGWLETIAKEMINNGIWHGNKSSTKEIRICTGWRGDDFYFVVIDKGMGFDMENPEIDWEFNFYTEGMGMGIAISKKIADRVYNFQDPASYVCMSTNEVTRWKYYYSKICNLLPEKFRKKDKKMREIYKIFQEATQ